MNYAVMSLLFLMVPMFLTASTPVFSQTNATDGNGGQYNLERGLELERGREVFLDRDRGHCLLCHQVQQLAQDEQGGFQGNLGPDLSNVGSRLSRAQIRARIADPTRLNPETVMPAYGRVSDLQQVEQSYKDKSILKPAEIEDLTAFLTQLTRTIDEPR